MPKCIVEKKLPRTCGNVKIERDGDIAVVNDPPDRKSKNALCAKAVQELKAAFEELDADASIKGVLFITGYEGALSGADVNELAVLSTRE